MSSPTFRRKRLDRLCLRNEKFSKLLRKRPRREMPPFRACYFRSFRLKDSLSPPRQMAPASAMHASSDSLLSEILRSKSEGLRRSLLPTSSATALERRSITKKILCHKLKRRLQYKHRRRLIREDLEKRIRAYRSWSARRPQRGRVEDVLKKCEKKSCLGRIGAEPAVKKTLKVSPPKIQKQFLKLGSGIPDLELDPDFKLDIESETEASRVPEDEEFALSFTKKVTGDDLSGRPLLAMLRKGSRVRSKCFGFACK